MILSIRLQPSLNNGDLSVSRARVSLTLSSKSKSRRIVTQTSRSGCCSGYRARSNQLPKDYRD